MHLIETCNNKQLKSILNVNNFIHYYYIKFLLKINENNI